MSNELWLLVDFRRLFVELLRWWKSEFPPVSASFSGRRVEKQLSNLVLER